MRIPLTADSGCPVCCGTGRKLLNYLGTPEPVAGDLCDCVRGEPQPEVEDVAAEESEA